MLSQIQVYYPTAKNGILPFIIAPVTGHQDSLILGPIELTKEHDEFLNCIYRHIANKTPRATYLRVFPYRRWVAVSASFPSSVPERESGRGGSLLTLGALIRKGVFLKFVQPSSSYMTVLLSQFNSIFKVDVCSGGANDFLQIVDSELCQDRVKSGLQQLLSPLLELALLVRPRRFEFLPLRRNLVSQRGYPKLILFNEGEQLGPIRAFFTAVDLRCATFVTRSTNISSESFHKEASVRMVAIGFPLGKAKRASLMSGSTENYIAVY